MGRAGRQRRPSAVDGRGRAARIRLMLRLGELRETRMGAAAAAIEIYREVLDRDPSCARRARRARAAARAARAPAARSPRSSSRCTATSGEFAEADRRPRDPGARTATSADQRVELLAPHGRAVRDAARRPARSAFECHARALAEDPGNPNTQEQLERLAARGAGVASAGARPTRRSSRAARIRRSRAALHVKAAEIREMRLGDVEGAIEHYRKVLELDRRQPRAATALERLYQAARALRRARRRST